MKVLILGAKGMLGQELMKVFGNEGIGWDREDADISDIENCKLQIENLQPDVLINCAAYNNVDGAEDNRAVAMKLNAEAVGELAAIARGLDIPLVHFSTNYVFDGEKGEYAESDVPRPTSAYSESKYRGEQLLQENANKYYLIRTSLLFGPKGKSQASKRSFVELMLELSAKTGTISAVDDEVNSITYAPDLAQAVKEIVAAKKPYGVYHVTNFGSASWYDLAKQIFATTGKNIEVVPVPSSSFPRKAHRPKKAVLLNTKLQPLRPWQDALKEFLISNY